MKKLMVWLMAISLLALAVPAFADCDVDFDVNVVKDVSVDKFIYIDKYFFVDTYVFAEPYSLAECDVWKCDLNELNLVNSYLGYYTDDIVSSFNEFVGIGQANQAAGFDNNQGNIVAASVITSNYSVAAMTEVAVEQTSYFNTLTSDYDISYDTITDSFSYFTGIGQANQSAGHMNNQNNVVAVSAGLGSCIGTDLVATNDTYLTQKNSYNYAYATYALNANTVTNSFNGFEGIGQVNQSAGSMNNQANIVSVSYTGPRP